jgi:chromosome segregation ATPase
MTNYIQYKSIEILNSKYKNWFNLFLYFCIILTCNIFLNENLAFLMQEDSQEESLITEVTRLKNKNIYLRNKLMKANELLRAQPDVEVLEQELELSQAESNRLNTELEQTANKLMELDFKYNQVTTVHETERNYISLLEEQLEKAQSKISDLEFDKNRLKNIEPSHLFAKMEELEQQMENVKVENRNLFLEKSQIENKKNVLENIVRNHIIDNTSTTKPTLIRRKTH